RQQRAVRVRDRPADRDVGDEVEAEEQRRPDDRACGELRVSRDQDGREGDAGEEGCRDEAGELAAPRAHRRIPQYRTSRPTTTTSARNASAASRPPSPAPWRRPALSGASRTPPGAGAAGSDGGGLSPSASSNSTTVMLSSPPCALAASTRAWAAGCGSRSAARSTSAISSSDTMSVRPSEQRRKRSPIS